MHVEQIWTGNAYRNFNYLIVCEASGEALAVDPLDSDKCLAVAKKHGWEITKVLNTHEHFDHTGGNEAVIAATKAKLFAHAKASIEGVDVGLGVGDGESVGTSVELEALDTPGHTMSHICLYAHSDSPALFCGDTLFNAGAGNCHNGGDPDDMYMTFTQQLSILPDSTRIYPGHDYIDNNLRFTLDREPDNEAAQQILQKTEMQDLDKALISTLALEKEINTFFRLQNPTVIARLREKFDELPEQVDARTVFLKLRELRNNW